jgi:anthranilate phosphoribosyltransferase
MNAPTERSLQFQPGRSIERVLEGETLSQTEMADCVTEMLSGAVTPNRIAALLAALRVRGETEDELTGAALAVRAMATQVRVEADIFVDTCGTGGDGANTFNISTGSAFIAAACGVIVAKHGNRSVSSRCGSADVLEQLGVRLDLGVPELEQLIARTGLGFLFAPAHHPAFQHVAAVRRELGVRTIFNLIGPLANPAGARHQVLGVFAAHLIEKMARVLLRLGTARALVVHGSGLDEISVCGPTNIASIESGFIQLYAVSPRELGLETHEPSALRGGDAAHNARMISDVLDGQRGAPRDAVLANSAAALVVAGQVDSLCAGVARAARVIDSGAARAHFDRFVQAQHSQKNILDEILEARHRTVSVTAAKSTLETQKSQRFLKALSPRHGPTRIIAEIKRRSPSSGSIAPIVDATLLAQQYAASGAAALSVLTNSSHFGGSLADLKSVSQAVSIPLLRKEFVVDPLQLDEAVTAGASAVLLIASVLQSGLVKMILEATRVGLDALVEVHDEGELALALSAGALIVGINNRDLKSFQVDLAVTERLAPLVPHDVILVSESGIRSQDDVTRLRRIGISNFLVGEFLVRGGTLPT